jgi:2-dehydropantoate 2-reductase
MKVGVFGAGSIGAYLGGRLIAAGVPTTLVARPSFADAIRPSGLRLTALDGFEVTLPAERVPIATRADALADCDWVLVTVKGLDTPTAAAALAPVLGHEAVVVSFQNGVGNPDVLRGALGDRVLAGMVPFNVLRRGEAHLHQGTTGRLVVGTRPDGRHEDLVRALVGAGLPAFAHDDMRGVQWGKLLVNLNNSINALSGLTLVEQLAQRGYRRIMAACVREGLAVIKRAKIKPRLDAPLPPSWVPALMELPNVIFRMAARPIVAIDPTARSSMWEDLQRGRKTEIDLLNGEIVRLGASVGVPTPINERIVQLVKDAERAGAPPSLTADELTSRTMRN